MCITDRLGAGSEASQTSELLSGNDYRTIIQPGAPSTFQKDPGKHNPYGRDTEQPFLISESMELLALTSFDVDSSSSHKSLIWGKNYKNHINTQNTQPQAQGTTEKAYYSDSQIWSGGSYSGFTSAGVFGGNGGWDGKYKLYFAIAVAWETTGS